ncbi:FUSC family protein [Bradyrhizobium sp. UFLA05-109]
MTHTVSQHGASHHFNWNVATTINGELLGAVVFSLKTFCAALLALFIAFWLGLDDPRWSLLTVYIVSQPDSGLVLAKSFYRMLGTIGGVLITIALVFALSQYGELFLASLAIWIGACNFAARATRNFASYGIQLAGYTLAIVGIPAALNPAGAYPLILARFTEIALGIGCAALVSRLVFPGELATKFLARTREFALGAKRFAEASIEPGANPQILDAEIIRLATAFGTVDAMRSAAFFESADARIRSELLRNLTYAAAELCIVAHLARTRSGTVGAPAVSQTRQKLLEAEAMFDHGQIVPGGAGTRRLWSDPVAAALVGIRSALAVAIATFFWFATAWPNGPTAVVVAAVICTLVASIDRPEKISLALGATVLIAAVPAFVTQFYLLPYSVDFVSMSLALAPVMLTCGFIMAQPKIGPLGLLAAVYFAFASNIDNVMTYDATSFLNSSLAILVGIGVAATLFATFFPETPTLVFRRFCRQLFARLSAAGTQASLQSVGFGVCEQLAGILPKVKSEPALERNCLAASAITLSSGRAMAQLHTAIATRRLPPGIVVELSGLLDYLSLTYADPTRTHLIASAWRARALRRHSLMAARTTSACEEIDAIAEVIAGCEMLRCSLLRARTLVRETRHVR